MPIYHEIVKEIQALSAAPGPQDKVRHKYLRLLHSHTKRDTILYATSYTAKPSPGALISISLRDVPAIMSALKGLKGDKLDIVLHSPGGVAEATEQIVNYLRAKYSHVRVIVPLNAMSAATMLACAADEIVMGKHSALGPIDPQLNLNGKSIAAQAILDEFQQALNAAGPEQLAIWLERAKELPPGMLQACQNAIDLAKKLVEDWLASYMFVGDSDAPSRAHHLAQWLGSHEGFKSHGRPISYALAKQYGLKVAALEDDPQLQDRVLSLFHASEATFANTSCVKIVENHNGKGSYLSAHPSKRE